MTSAFFAKAVHEEIIDLLDDAAFKNNVEDFVSNNVENKFPLLSSKDRHDITFKVINDILGYGFLEDLLNDAQVNEIMINSSSCVFVDRGGEMEKVEVSFSNEELFRVAQKIASTVGARCDNASPVLDAWLKDGSRVHVVLPPIAADGPYMTIRRFISRTYDLKQFCEDENDQKKIAQLITSRKNIVVAGGTSSGKTTLLNCLISKVKKNERIISIEETAELKADHPHWVRLLSRNANTEGAGEVSIGDLVKASLRMRPDRLIVGEVRSAEAFDLIQALNTGHDGSLCTIHANGAREVIHRMASLAMLTHAGLSYDAIVSQVCFGIDAIVFVRRTFQGKRNISSISHLDRAGISPRLVDSATGKCSDI